MVSSTSSCGQPHPSHFTSMHGLLSDCGALLASASAEAVAILCEALRIVNRSPRCSAVLRFTPMAKRKNPHAQALGSRGGKRRLQTMTDDERSESARKAAVARWAKTKKTK